MRRMIMIVGLPGTGKSTIAAALSRELSAIHLSTDIVRKEYGLIARYDDQSKMKVYHLLEQAAKAALHKNKCVVLDGTFMHEAQRAPFFSLAASLQIAPIVIEMKANEALIRRRVSQKRMDSEADYDVYLTLTKEWEPFLTPHFIMDSSDVPVSALITQGINYIENESVRNSTINSQ